MTVPTLDLDQLEALLEKAPPLPWFQCDEQPYLHCSKDGTLPVNPKPWDYAVVGRFDYSKGAMDAIAALRNDAPDLIQAARRVERLEALVARFVAQCDTPIKQLEEGSLVQLLGDARIELSLKEPS